MRRVLDSWLVYAAGGFVFAGCLVALVAIVFFLDDQKARLTPTPLPSPGEPTLTPTKEPPVPTSTTLAQGLFEQAEYYLANWEPEKVKPLLFPRLGELQNDEELAQAYKLLGDAEYQQGHSQIAAGFYESVYTYQPSVGNLIFLARLYDMGGDLVHALEKYELLLALEDPAAETYRAEAEFRAENIKDVLDHRYKAGTYAPIITPESQLTQTPED
jgi:tetratricopeptide (TPR) repeat protein